MSCVSWNGEAIAIGIDSVGDVEVCVLSVVIHFDRVKRSDAFFIGRAMEEIIDGKMNNKADALKYGEYVAAAQQNGVTEDTILDNSLGGLFEKVSSPDHTKMIVKLADEIEVSQNSIVKTAYNKNIPKGHLDALIPEGILTAVAINAFYNP